MDNQKTSRLQLTGWFGIVAMLLILGVGVTFLARNYKSQGPSVAEVARHPENYYGQQVSLTGQIENAKTPRIFTLDQKGAATSDEILVISIPSIEPQGGSSGDLSSLNNQDVQVNGTVRKFVAADIQKEIGLNLDRQITLSLENKPVIIAREVQFLPEHQDSTTK